MRQHGYPGPSAPPLQGYQLLVEGRPTYEKSRLQALHEAGYDQVLGMCQRREDGDQDSGPPKDSGEVCDLSPAVSVGQATCGHRKEHGYGCCDGPPPAEYVRASPLHIDHVYPAKRHSNM